jgi:UDP-N-acetylmuramyl pentapeptide phosphotransferase/UDP-N-acetylglucosamine-1-phosphate transferase
MTNLYNFMDGSDGLAGGMALFGFSTYAAAAAFGGAPDVVLLSLCLAAAAAAFLAFNFHPARIFMGDVGSIPLGFLAGSLGLLGWDRNIWPLWFPLLVFSPFIVDASVTLARRALRGERVWQAHRDHYYQRMVRSGLGHAGTALRWYAVMAAAGASSLLALFAPQHLQYLALLAWLSIYLCAGWLIDRRWRNHLNESANP